MEKLLLENKIDVFDIKMIKRDNKYFVEFISPTYAAFGFKTFTYDEAYAKNIYDVLITYLDKNRLLPVTGIEEAVASYFDELEHKRIADMLMK